MNIPDPKDPVAMLNEALPNAVEDSRIFRDELTIVVGASHIQDVMRYLRDTPGLVFNYLSDISAVDYYPDYDRPDRFGISYHIYSMLYSRRIRVKVYASEEEPVVPTVTEIWSGANWLEREIVDMMGIDFEGHPDKRRLIMPDDWDGHPHRRDYPLGYETVQFSFNVEDISKHKPLAKE